MRKLTLPLFLALILPTLVFSQDKTKSTWTPKDRTDFINSCAETAKASLGVDTAKYYCACMQAKVEEIFPSVDAANKGLTDEVLATQEWQNRILECLKLDKKRGANGTITTSTVNTDGGKFYALIIGVSTYNNPKLNLDNAAGDATKIRDIITTKYTFDAANTNLLINPTRQKIISELFRLRKIITSEDNLLIFYAGHGYWDNDAKQGYWWARDAEGDDPSTWLSNSDLREQIRSIKSAHTLLISDACFSGGIFRSRDASEIMKATQDIQLLYSMPSRRAITSGTMTAVPDRSVFLEYLSKRLTDNKSKFLASQQLFDSFRTAVINNSSVVPQDGVIAETGDEGGDFIFILRDK